MLRPSRWLAAAVIVAHCAALAAAVACLPAAAAGIAGAGVVLSAIAHVRAALHQTPLAVAGVDLDADGAVAIAGPQGEWSAASLRNAAVPAAWLAVLSLRDARGLRRTAVVLPDALDPDAFRRLRMWLRWRPPGTAQQIVKANDPTRR